MTDTFSRLELLLPGATAVLAEKTVAVFGLGGVGGACVEALSRSAIGGLIIVDNDVVSDSNINRQLIALKSTIGCKKTQLFAERINDINPNCRVVVFDEFYSGGSEPLVGADYVIDCIDTVTAKLALIDEAKRLGIPVLSCMGTGNKLDPTRLKITDIEKTSVCPLARVMRRELKAREIKDVKVLYSEEQPNTAVAAQEHGRHSPASAVFVPMTAGLMLAKEAIFDLLNKERQRND